MSSPSLRIASDESTAKASLHYPGPGGKALFDLQKCCSDRVVRNLEFATIEQRLRCVQRFLHHVNEDPWNWTPAMVEEFSADLRTVKHVAHSTLTTPRCARSPATSATPTTAGTGSARRTSARTPPRSSSTRTPLPTSRSTTGVLQSVRTPAKSSARCSTTPGECYETLIRERMIQSFGSEYSDLAGALAGKTPSEIDTLLQGSSGATSTPEASPDVVILNPETAPRALLDSLQRVVIHVRLQTPLGPDFTICTKASVGWNDCFVADETAGPGVVVGGYVAADRRLEVWLLDEQANLAQPIRHIGDVLVPVDFAKLPEVALDLAVSIDGASPGTTPRAGDRVTLLDAVTTDALSSTDWPGLSNGGGIVAPAQPGNE